MFRDQNSLVKNLAVDKKSARLESHYHHPHSSVFRPFLINPDDAVLNQFSLSCPLGDSDEGGHGVLPIIMSSMYGSLDSTSPLVPAILAMAWVTSAPLATNKQRMCVARLKYADAIVKLREALQDPRTAKTDDALLTVMLMLILEVSNPFVLIVTSLSLIDIVAELRNTEHDCHLQVHAMSDKAHVWSRHVSQLPSVAQFFERPGQETVLCCENHLSIPESTYFQAIHTNCVQTALPAWYNTGSFTFSLEVIKAHRCACARDKSPSLSTRLGNIAFEIFLLRENLDRAILDRSKPQIVRDLLQQSRGLAQELMTWRLSVPGEWEKFSYISPSVAERSLEETESADTSTWLGYTASYPNLFTARLLNAFRIHSIAIHAIELRFADWVARHGSDERLAQGVPLSESFATAHDSSIHSKSQRFIRTLVDGICASVPFHLDRLALNGQSKSFNLDRPSEPLNTTRPGEIASPSSDKSRPASKGLGPPVGGMMLLQSLAVAYSAPGVPADQKKWIMGMSLGIAKLAGMDDEMVGKVLDSLAGG